MGSLRGAIRRSIREHCKIVGLLLMLAYQIAIITCLVAMYWKVVNDSPVTYYVYPRHPELCMTGNGTDTFIETFCRPPEKTYLQITGYREVDQYEEDSVVEWKEKCYALEFSFALDLTDWIVADGELDAEDRRLLE